MHLHMNGFRHPAVERSHVFGPDAAFDEQIYKDANAKLYENFVDISLHSMQTAPEIRQVLDAFHPLEGTNDPNDHFQHQSHP